MTHPEDQVFTRPDTGMPGITTRELFALFYDCFTRFSGAYVNPEGSVSRADELIAALNKKVEEPYNKG